MADVSEYVNHPVSRMGAAATPIGAKLWGLTLNEWVLAGSAVLIALQIYVLVRDKFYRPWKDKKDGSNRSRPDAD